MFEPLIWIHVHAKGGLKFKKRKTFLFDLFLTLILWVSKNVSSSQKCPRKTNVVLSLTLYHKCVRKLDRTLASLELADTDGAVCLFYVIQPLSQSALRRWWIMFANPRNFHVTAASEAWLVGYRQSENVRNRRCERNKIRKWSTWFKKTIKEPVYF